MDGIAVTLALVASANALVPRQSQCCFGLTANGGPGGPLGQLSDGQNRIGQGLPASQYCITNGAITDSTGNGCILTPPTTQFQCDSGAQPQPGFAVDHTNTLTYDGSPQFFACQTGVGGMNIYTSDSAGQIDCVPITLTSSSCSAPAPPPPPPAPSAAPSSCPANLNGGYEYPHLITRVDSANPNTAYGTSYNGEVSPTVSSIYNFDIPADDAGKTCTLVFLMPKQSELSTSSFNVSGPGSIDFSMLDNVANAGTSYSNAPAVKQNYGTTTMAPGNGYAVASMPCPANEAVAFEMKSTDGTNLAYFQDWNAPGIGVYVTVC